MTLFYSGFAVECLHFPGWPGHRTEHISQKLRPHDFPPLLTHPRHAEPDVVSFFPMIY